MNKILTSTIIFIINTAFITATVISIYLYYYNIYRGPWLLLWLVILLLNIIVSYIEYNQKNTVYIVSFKHYPSTHAAFSSRKKAENYIKNNSDDYPYSLTVKEFYLNQ